MKRKEGRCDKSHVCLSHTNDMSVQIIESVVRGFLWMVDGV